MMLFINAFTDVWELGLAVFGVHLTLLGYLFLRSGYISRWLSILVGIAGIGYLVDSFGGILLNGLGISVAAFTFLGEVLLIFWLLLGFRRAGASPSDVPAQDAQVEVPAR